MVRFVHVKRNPKFDEKNALCGGTSFCLGFFETHPLGAAVKRPKTYHTVTFHEILSSYVPAEYEEATLLEIVFFSRAAVRI